MMTRPYTTKLTELRERTDRELIAWIDKRLEFGLQTHGSVAEDIYLEVAPLLMVANANPYDRARLELKLERLCESFQALCSTA
jgi:hypothetical protein